MHRRSWTTRTEGSDSLIQINGSFAILDVIFALIFKRRPAQSPIQFTRLKLLPIDIMISAKLEPVGTIFCMNQTARGWQMISLCYLNSCSRDPSHLLHSDLNIFKRGKATKEKEKGTWVSYQDTYLSRIHLHKHLSKRVCQNVHKTTEKLSKLFPAERFPRHSSLSRFLEVRISETQIWATIWCRADDC